ncbi:MAG: transcription termination/antitermination protein NusA [Gemmatales bacterium]|nr:MAG: transcription termination/antitermination protein NusA [Gemmatales bacterium]
MNGADLLRIVDMMHRDKNIPKDIIFGGIEAAVQLAMEKQYGENSNIVVGIDRESGEIHAQKGEEMIDPAILGRIAAQSAKQVMIQKIREAEGQAVFNEYAALKGDLVQGVIQRFDGGAATVALGKSEAILPRSEQIPGETHHVGERVKAVILDVKKIGHRVKIVLSRTHAEFVRRLFENEIPEIADRTIEIKAIAREAGYRAKIAVSSIDLKVDCVGACVGVRGSRIKNIVDELGGERIDIVRWNDSLQVLIPNALQPATIEEVFLYPRLGRAIVLVKEDQLSLAIGRRGQNVRLASKLVGWDIEIMTHDELNEGIEKAEAWFRNIPGISDEQIEAFIEEGFLSFDDLTFMEPSQLAELAGTSEEQAAEWIEFAEAAAEQLEAEAKATRAMEELEESAGPIKSTPLQRAEELLGGGDRETETKPTLESLFAEQPTQEEPQPDEIVDASMTSATEEPQPAAAEGDDLQQIPEEAPQPIAETVAETTQVADSSEKEGDENTGPPSA